MFHFLHKSLKFSRNPKKNESRNRDKEIRSEFRPLYYKISNYSNLATFAITARNLWLLRHLCSEPTSQIQHPTKFTDHKSCKSGAIIILVSHINSDCHVLKVSCELNGEASHKSTRWLTWYPKVFYKWIYNVCSFSCEFTKQRPERPFGFIGGSSLRQNLVAIGTRIGKI